MLLHNMEGVSLRGQLVRLCPLQGLPHSCFQVLTSRLEYTATKHHIMRLSLTIILRKVGREFAFVRNNLVKLLFRLPLLSSTVLYDRRWYATMLSLCNLEQL
jgi:hypothetical protein